MLEPAAMAGTIGGVMLNRLLPSWLVCSLMILVLGFVTVRMAIRGVQDFRAESRAMRAAASASEPESGISALKKQEVDTDGAEESDDGDDSAALDGENVRSAKAEIGMQMQQLHDDADDPARDDNAGETQDDLQGNSRLNPSRDVPGLPPVLVGAKDTDKAGLLAADDQSDNLTVSDTYNPDRTVHPFPVLMLVWAFVVIILSSLIRGGHGSPSIVGAPCGGIVFYAVAAAAFAAILAVLALYAWWVVRRMRTKERLGFAFLPSDIRWTGRRAAACVVLFSVAGVVAGLLGQGGALMFSPILLEMKALPEVVAATVPFMVLFTALSTTTQFLALGGIRWDYALWMFVWGALGTVLGQIVYTRLRRYIARRSLVVLMMAVLTGNALVLLGVFGVRDLVMNGLTGLRDVCS